jgi:hypothetical protein
MKQVPHLELKNVEDYCTKFSYQSDLAAGIAAPISEIMYCISNLFNLNKEYCGKKISFWNNEIYVCRKLSLHLA